MAELEQPADGGPRVPAASGPPPSADLGPRVLAAVGWTVFGLVAIDRVGNGPLTSLDGPLMRVIPHEGALHTVSGIATHVGDPIVLAALTLLGTAILLLRRAYIDAGILALAEAVTVTVVQGLKLLFDRARPGIGPEAGACCAFPSGHATGTAMLFMLMAVLLFEQRERLRPWAEGVAIGLALVVGATRTIIAVHFPTDVLAGWGLGWALAGTFLLLRAHLHRRRGHRWAMTEQQPANAGAAEVQPKARADASGRWDPSSRDPARQDEAPARACAPRARG